MTQPERAQMRTSFHTLPMGPKRSGRVGARLAAVAVAVAMTAAGCGLVNIPDPAGAAGTLVLGIDPQAMAARTIEPGLNMSAASYDVRGDGPGQAFFSSRGVTSGTVQEHSLAPGDWRVTVDAFNTDTPPTRIGSGNVDVTVRSGNSVQAVVRVDPLPGPGALDLALSWPQGVLANPAVVSTLTPIGGSSSLPLGFTVSNSANGSSNGPTAEYSGDRIAAGYYTLNLKLEDGSRVVWGTAEVVRIVSGQTSSGTFSLASSVNAGGLVLKVVVDLGNPIAVSLAGTPATMAIDKPMGAQATPSNESAYDYYWYVNGVAIVPPDVNRGAPPPQKSTAVIGAGPVALPPGPNTLSVVVSDGRVLGSASMTFTVTDVPGAPGAKAASKGRCYTAALKQDGTIYWWGIDPNGGICTDPPRPPARLDSSASWASLSGGNNDIYAIRSDGTLWAWGSNSFGELGSGTTSAGTSFGSAATQIGSGTNWTDVSGGGMFGALHTVARRSDGTLWAWGRNDHGQLGDGTTVNRNAPVQVGSASDWATAVAGAGYTLAVKTDGSLWAWGSDANGQLGDGTTTDQSTPERIGMDTNWRAIAAGNGGSYAIRTDGTLWIWGGAWTLPVQVGSGSSWQSLGCGSLAIRSDGTLWSISSTPAPAATRVGADSDWGQVTCAESGIKRDGSIWRIGTDPTTGATVVQNRVVF